MTVIPFDSDKRWMAILRRDGVHYFKGAVEALAARTAGDTHAMTAAAAEMAGGGCACSPSAWPAVRRR